MLSHLLSDYSIFHSLNPPIFTVYSFSCRTSPSITALLFMNKPLIIPLILHLTHYPVLVIFVHCGFNILSMPQSTYNHTPLIYIHLQILLTLLNDTTYDNFYILHDISISLVVYNTYYPDNPITSIYTLL